jgi:hypothetical protein
LSAKRITHRRWNFEPAQLEAYRGTGYNLIRLHVPDALDARGRSIGKAPFKGWRTDPALTVDEAIDHMAGGGNVGVRLGALDLVIDVDPRNFAEGDDPLGRLEKDLKIDLGPDQYPRVVTGSGGYHIYTKLPEATLLLDSLPDYQGIEFKSLGRQVVAAGSAHPEFNKPYVFDQDPLARRLSECAPEAPKALVELVRRPERQSGTEVGDFTPEQLGEMLEGLDPTQFRDHTKWLELMMACHHATGGDGRDEFLEWSASDPQYAKDSWLVGRRWDSLHADGSGRRITMKSLFKALYDAGQGDRIPRDSAADDFAGFEDEDWLPPEPEPEVRQKIAAAADARRRRRVTEFSLQPNEWVIDNFMLTGLNLVAGTWGVGKSTNLIPVAATVAHLTPTGPGWDLPRPRLRRKVAWITEDHHQAMLTLMSIERMQGAASAEEMMEWFIIEEARRMGPADLAKSISELVDELSYENDYGFTVRPLIVVDTSSSNLDLDSENDNSEVGKAMAALKETRAPVILVGHTAKDIKRSDLESMSFRGGGAYEADARGTYYLIHDETDGVDAGRHLILRKRRFADPAFTEVAFDGHFGNEQVSVPWGPEKQTIGYCHGVPRRSDKERREASKALLKEEQSAKKAAQRSDKLVAAVGKLIAEGRAPTRDAIAEQAEGKTDLNRMALKGVIEEGGLRPYKLTAEDRVAFGLATKGPAPEALLPPEMDLDELREKLLRKRVSA